MVRLFARQGLAFALTLALALSAADRAAAESFVIDPKNTEVRFTYTLGFAVQQGRFTAVQGSMHFDDKAPEKTRVSAVIKTASLTTGAPMIESELKGRDFFDAARQPEIVFKSQKVRMKGSDTAQMTGAITVNGITRPITLDVSIKPGDDAKLKHRVGTRRFTAVGRIRRSDFKMTAYSAMVDDNIGIEIDALMKKQGVKSSATNPTELR